MDNCPNCGGKNIGPGPNYDNFRWIGCYDCGYGFTSKPRKLNSMDNANEINAAIAEAMGCQFVDDYCSSLDAMHEVEATLGSDSDDYNQILLELSVNGARVCDFALYPGDFVWHATAAQRAEAFLKVKGLWKW